MTRPRFTIAIPAKNRPDRMRNAVRSVLDQTWTDLEVIVCDNSDAAEAVATSAVVKSFDDPRLVYVRTSGSLSMPDNWERALQDARGEYVGILTDRSVLRRDALQLAAAEIDRTDADVICWFPDSYGRDVAGRVYRPRRCSLKRVEHEASDLLNYFLHGNPKYSPKVLPKLMTAVCRRDILDRARSSPLGRICPPVCPDYTSGYLMLGLGRRVVVIDDGLFISCGLGNGAAFRRKGPLADRFLRDLGLGWKELVGQMPTDACFTHALVMNDFMFVKGKLPDVFAKYEFDRTQYYLGCLTDYNRSARNGVDRTEDLDALIDGLSQESEAVQASVRGRRAYVASAMQLPSDEQKHAPVDPDEAPDPAEDLAALRFDTVFDAMAWAERHPRLPSEGDVLSMPSIDTLDRWDRRKADVVGGEA